MSTDATTRYQVWAAIVDTTHELERLVATEVGDLPQRGPLASAAVRTRPPQLETSWRDPGAIGGGVGERAEASAMLRVAEPDDRDRASLTKLRASVSARVNLLWARLETQRGNTQIREALVIYFDERVMASLPEYLRLSWPLLQTDLTRSKTGGSDFFRFIDRALDDPKTPQLVFEVYYFCLNHGFQGRYSNELAQLDAYRRKLVARVEVSVPSAEAAPAETEGNLGKPWPVWAYYLVAGVAVVVISVLATVLSNYRSTEPTEAEARINALSEASIEAAIQRCPP
ncbi:DotU family type IV/VI secretion system protein [Enhygromyxa salina]|uniref:Type IV / VI secretion system DotU domain-containing protein n=1 Tax=Enhygromyxa salina TaxID=215803 RepID=A0A2S9YU93_9BACT|nr:DotU family type IV/VI secretion system protein [Enhygromyxa salina]PRQ08677.1 hypothetical protein ENSA7_16220 [Enhygromyxa salina]